MRFVPVAHLGMRAHVTAAVVVAAGLIALGCGADDDRASISSIEPSARSDRDAGGAAERFFEVFFNEHQTGRLSAGGRAVLRATTTSDVYQELIDGSDQIPESDGPCDEPRIRPLDGENGSVVADVVVRCPTNPGIGYGVRLEERDGRWLVVSLDDARCDLDVAASSRADCSAWSSADP